MDFRCFAGDFTGPVSRVLSPCPLFPLLFDFTRSQAPALYAYRLLEAANLWWFSGFRMGTFNAVIIVDSQYIIMLLFRTNVKADLIIAIFP